MSQHDGDFAIEVELTDHTLGEIRALPPEEAWTLGRAYDATLGVPVIVEE